MTYSTTWLNEIFVVGLEGDLIGGFSTQALLDEANEKISTGTRLCAIDILNVRYINSAGIDVLITMLTKFRNKGGEVVIVSPSVQVQKLLIITKLNAIFQLASSQEEAVEKLNASL